MHWYSPAVMRLCRNINALPVILEILFGGHLWSWSSTSQCLLLCINIPRCYAAMLSTPILCTPMLCSHVMHSLYKISQDASQDVAAFIIARQSFKYLYLDCLLLCIYTARCYATICDAVPVIWVIYSWWSYYALPTIMHLYCPMLCTTCYISSYHYLPAYYVPRRNYGIYQHGGWRQFWTQSRWFLSDWKRDWYLTECNHTCQDKPQMETDVKYKARCVPLHLAEISLYIYNRCDIDRCNRCDIDICDRCNIYRCNRCDIHRCNRCDGSEPRKITSASNDMGCT